MLKAAAFALALVIGTLLVTPLEAQGKWLDAYIVCYSWLKAIYKDNKAYEDYAEQLLDKAEIVASFEDSPCETSSQRYAGIKKKMFTKSVNILHSNYVNIVDYQEMATEAIKRCKLLAEVMGLSFSQIQRVTSMTVMKRS